MTEFIIEVANTHGGDKQYVHELIKEFKKFKGHGIKFQPLHPDELATKDFEWYPVYKDLFFSPEEWTEIINDAKESKKVWLDLFDPYGVSILEQNKASIFGIKLQASVLYNEHVLEALQRADCSELKVIINISAIEKVLIQERLDHIQNLIGPKEILLEVGFQSYPTEMVDSGFKKIIDLQAEFSNPLVFADHTEGTLDDAIILPLMAMMHGANYIEKHVMHSSLETKYDHFSSITCHQYEQLVEKTKNYAELLEQPFINDKERTYLSSTLQKPLTSRRKLKGQGISTLDDLSYKRSGKNGIDSLELKKLKQEKYILAKDINEGETLKQEDFKKATIAVIVAGRLKSSRLKRKAVLNIGELNSVEKCIQSCLRIHDSTYTVLATSTAEDDAELAKHTYAPQVLFHQGHPDDVIRRYLDVVDKNNIDVIVRVTADMPYISKEITKYLLDSHFSSGADYTAPRQCSVGTAPQIINAQALRKVKEHFPNADYSEYMTWYFENNPEHFAINMVDLPEEYVRDYRLTLDFQEDLDMLNAIQEYLDKHNMEGGLKEIFEFLDGNPNIADINNHISLKYKTDQKLIDTLNKVTKIQS